MTPILGSHLLGKGQNPLKAGLIHYWTLNETTGSRVDSFGTAHLTPINAPGYAAGVRGNCVDLEQDSAQQLNGPVINLGNTSWTISWWARPESKPSSGNYHSFCHVGEVWSGSGGPDIKYTFNDQMAFIFYRGSNNDSITIHASMKALNQWCFLVFTHDATARQISAWSYASGSRAGDQMLHSGWAANPSTIAFTISPAANLRFDGCFDEVGMWNRVLTLAEMNALYNAGAGYALYP